MPILDPRALVFYHVTEGVCHAQKRRALGSRMRSAVLVSSRTSFHQSSRRVEDVTVLLLFVPTNVPIDLIFSHIDKNVSKVHIFRDFSVQYYAEIRKCE